METKISNLVEAQAVYQDASQKLPLLPQALPKDPNIIAVLLAFRTMSDEANASISGIAVQAVPISGKEATVSAKPAKVTATPDVFGTPITMSIDGTYDGLKKILDNTMNMRRIVTIQSYTITNESEITSVSNPNPTLRLVIKVIANYFPGASYER